MGCDIHLYTERRVKRGENFFWVNCDYFIANPDFDEENEFENEPFDVRNLYWHRNYYLFALLADVRNNGVEPLSEPRGIPEDLHELTETFFDKWKGDAHSHSYYTYNEFVNFRKQKQYDIDKLSGYVSPKEIKEIESGLKKFPTDYILPDVNENLKIQLIKNDYRYMSWETSESDDMLDNFQKIIENRMMDIFEMNDIKECVEKHGDDFRIVFFFDN